MSLPRYEVPTGAINGSNLMFFVSTAYTPGSVAVYLNGQLLIASAGNPWTETNPATGQVDLFVEATPQLLDEVAIFYLDTTATIVMEVQPLHGVLEGPIPVEGVLSLLELSGVLSAPALSGSIDSLDLAGVLDLPEIDGTLECD